MPSQQGESEPLPAPPPQDALVRYTVYGRRAQPVTADEAFAEIHRALEAMTDVSPEEVAAAKEAFQRLAADADVFQFSSATRQEKPEWFLRLDDDVGKGLLLAGRAPETSDHAICHDAETASVLIYQGPAWEAHYHLELMKRLADVIAQLGDGIVTDFVALSLYGSESWREMMMEERPHALNHLSLHYVRGDGGSGDTGVWIHTHGMSKFALPDLELRRVPSNFQEAGASLLIEAAQWLIENGDAPWGTVHPFGFHNSEWVFMPILDAEEHYSGTVLGLAPPDDNPFEPERMGEALFGYVGGGVDDKVGPPVEEDDAEINAAHDQAMARLPEFKVRFEAWVGGETADDTFAVKLGFETPKGEQENMWVTLLSWEDGKLNGVLMNEPEMVPGLKGGQEVTKGEAEIIDWMIIKQDRTWEGAFIDQVLMRRDGQEMPEKM